MTDALLKASDLEGPCASRNPVDDQESDDNTSTDGSVSLDTFWESGGLSRRLEKRRATCRYFDNYPRTIQSVQVLNNDYFYQEHLRSCHFSSCEPLPAPHDDILPEEPPLRAEVPFWLMTSHLTPVKLRDKLFSSRHIRLVRFLPSHFDDRQHGHLRLQSRSLQCIVYQVSLDDISSDGQPMFAALSYVCGNPALTQHVWCGEDYVPTTQNLFEALTYVRHEDCSRLLWADGLCINQEDTEERSHQVGLLHQIYSQAHVVVWLGAGDQTDLTAISTYLSSTARVWTSIVRSARAANSIRQEVRAAAILEYEERRDKQVTFPDVDHIVDAHYFTRVWVAQEIFLAQSAICQLGNLLFSVASLVASMELWEYHYDHLNQGTLDNINYFYLMPSLQGIWHGLQNTTRSQDLSIVAQFGEKECSDPKDHIYGLSALFKGPTAYPVDYSLSVAEVFCDFTVHCVKTLGSLSVLDDGICFRSIIMKPSQMTMLAVGGYGETFIDDGFALPSWCPSWRPPADFREHRSLRSDFRDHWDASGGHSIVLDRPSSLVITLRGCVVSNVRRCTSMQFERSLPRKSALIEEAVQFVPGCPRFPPPLSNMYDADIMRLITSILEILLFDFKSGLNLPHSTRTLLNKRKPKDTLLEFLGPVYVAGMLSGLCPLANLGIDTCIPTDDYEAIAQRVEDKILESNYGCLLFVTDGGMFGTGFSGMMAGDVVCILFGSNVPHILRPTQVEGQYLLVGECYVKELMEGQAMDMGLQEQTFTLV
jgi:hypothetical protein